MKNFMTLYEAGAVKRYHTHLTIREQDLAAHSWGVAMIVMQIAPNRPWILRAALLHDLHEIALGDIPYTAKRKYQAVADVEGPICRDFQGEHGYSTEKLEPGDFAILKWADMFECYLWSRREVEMGNRHLVKVMNTAWAKITAADAPTPEAAALARELHL